MKIIQVYGTGCASCNKLFELAKQVIQEMGADITVEKVEDLNELLAAGIMRTPGLSFDGKVILQGKMPNHRTLKHWIENFKG
ncbi:redox-active disulfide protein 2 [candidate division KSB1 bacterium 4484_188]|nr:MAG: redox-active disulfide protein 2 [candidate division KSB1 bacterium 4484_188]HFE64807.1 thioredoxin family protein [Caldithrix sp.]